MLASAVLAFCSFCACSSEPENCGERRMCRFLDKGELVAKYICEDEINDTMSCD